jgi:chemotaxis protein CheX
MISAVIFERLNTTIEQIVQHLDNDVREIFSTMVGIEISPSRSIDTETRFKNSVTAMVGFAGSYNGMIGINTP